MARLTPEQYAEKQARNLKNAVPDIRAGVDRVTAAPGVKAAQAQDRMKANVNAAIDSGRWAQKTSAVSLQQWQSDMKDKGVNRIAQGIDAAKDRQVQMAGRLLPAVDAAAAKSKALPKGTLEDSIARMTTFVREMAKVKGKV